MNYSKYREGTIVSKLVQLGVHPLDVMITGVTGAGKSTTLNTVFQKDVATVGDGVDPETMSIDAYSLNEDIRLWDTPGLGDGTYNDLVHSKGIINLLNKTYTYNGVKYGFIDLALVIIDGSNRDMGTTYRLINDVILPNIQSDRILVAINQADFAMKGRHWNNLNKKPDSELEQFLIEKSVSVQSRVKLSTGLIIKRPVYYSALHGYNINKFLDFIIDNIPTVRRPI